MTKGRAKAVLDFFEAGGARTQPWPANSYPKALYAYRGRGYAHVLPENGRYTLDTALLQRSASEHLKAEIGPTSYLAGSVSIPVGHLNRVVEQESDLVTIFNDLLSLEDPIALSQIFQVAERCHRNDKPQPRVWVTPGPAPKGLLTRVSDRVITIGDEPNNDFPVGRLTKEQLNESLEQLFAEFSTK
jgi:hypothetical protein